MSWISSRDAPLVRCIAVLFKNTSIITPLVEQGHNQIFDDKIVLLFYESVENTKLRRHCEKNALSNYHAKITMMAVRRRDQFYIPDLEVTLRNPTTTIKQPTCLL